MSSDGSAPSTDPVRGSASPRSGSNAPWHTGEPSPLADDDYVAYERIDRPVLLVAGAADKLRRLDDFHDRAERIPSCTTKVFDGGGHAPHIQFAEEFNELALRFLRSA